MAKLVLSLDGNLLNQYFIDKTDIRIGRDAGNEIAINDPLLSRVHARITCIGEDHIIEDLQSSNGSQVNGSPLQRQILQHKDVIQLGSHHLRYLNSRTATEIDLDRTMLIKALPRDGAEPTDDSPTRPVPTARASKTTFPGGSVKVIAGSGHHVIGETVRLDRVVTTFGTPGEQLAVITRRPSGFFLSHVEGVKLPRINQKTIGNEAHALHDGDQIEAADYRLEFRLNPPAEGK